MRIMLLPIALLCSSIIGAQGVYFTKSAQVQLDATAKNSPEEIKAKQASGTIAITEAGAIEAAVLMKSFLFKQALMQEHFNENYVESDKYPKAVFKGKVKEGTFSLTKDGSYAVTVEGKMTMHGVTNTLITPAKISVNRGKINVEADFSMTLADYGITIPNLVADKVAKVAIIKLTGALSKK